MASFNRVILAGNLTRDPQLKYLPNQTALVEFGIAVNRKWRDSTGQEKEDILFIDCGAFGKMAETINQWCRKGKPILIEGRLKFDSWDDKQGGGRRSKHSVVVESFQFLGGADGQSGQQSRPQPSSQAAQQSRSTQQRSSPPAQQVPYSYSPPNEQQFQEDDIPF